MTDDCKICNAIYDVREGGEPTGYCDPCAQNRVEELEAREPLVEEVIRLTQTLAAINKTNSSYPEWTNAQDELETACRKLAEFKS